ncbi:MAG: synthetase [Candidatus Parcubacteria bacterium]|nr:synthetase [Candidatus Parcubacteria bacterium]
MITGMVFGVFDGLHEGHKYFLRQALVRCNKLVVVVTVPEVAEALKKHPPQHSFEGRVAMLRKFDAQLEVIPGDKELGSWHVIRDYPPDIIFLGYDQAAIAKELDQLKKPYVFLDALQPGDFKSSLLNAKT